MPVFVVDAGSRSRVFVTVPSDADGRFVFTMPPATFFFVVEAPIAPRGWWTAHLQPRDLDLDLGDVDVPAAGAIVGSVRDHDRRPIPDAEIVATSVALGWSGPHGTPPPAARSGTDGTFRIDGLAPGNWTVRATAHGYRVADVGAQVAELALARADVTMRAGELRSGVVFDWHGAPLPGARVRAAGVEPVTTDEHGAFTIEDADRSEVLYVTAAGHLEYEQRPDASDGVEQVRLQRALTLRGVVRGTNGAATTIVLTGAPDAARGAAHARPYELMDTPLPVAADGSFVIEGLAAADLHVTAMSAGVGASRPLRVALRDDTSIELTVETTNLVRVLTRDPLGAPVDDVEVVVDPGIENSFALYRTNEREVQQRIFSSHRRQSSFTVGGVVLLPHSPADPLALGVRHARYLPQIRTFAANEVPREIVVTLERAGRVEGVVRGGAPGEHERSVTMWRVADEEKLLAFRRKPVSRPDWRPVEVPVDASGAFVAPCVAPGVWRAALSRTNRGYLCRRADQARFVSLVDDGDDARSRVEFSVGEGDTTTIEIVDPPLGTLRGQVLTNGAPRASAIVFAIRPRGADRPIDVDFDPSREVAADGTFVFRYRDAGPIELRVRDATSQAMSPPTIVDLPAPGAGEAQCTLHLSAGGVRGRFVDSRPELAIPRRAVLHPMARAAEEPSSADSILTGRDWQCSIVELPADGRFSFNGLPDGEWLVRVHERGRFDHPLVWQTVVRVRGEVVDLGDITPAAPVAVRLPYRFPNDGRFREVYGLWLRTAHGDDPAAVWAATATAREGIVDCTVPPGPYVIVPFGYDNEADALGADWRFARYRTLAQPFAVDIASDGSVTPREIVFVPLAK